MAFLRQIFARGFLLTLRKPFNILLYWVGSNLSKGYLSTRNFSRFVDTEFVAKKVPTRDLSTKYIFDRGNDARPLGREGRSVLTLLANLHSSFPSVLLVIARCEKKTLALLKRQRRFDLALSKIYLSTNCSRVGTFSF